jgi:hypothetical protein
MKLRDGKRVWKSLENPARVKHLILSRGATGRWSWHRQPCFFMGS